MKNKKLFVLLPIIALTACNSLGKEISESDANGKSQAIVKKQNSAKVYSFSMSTATNTKEAKDTANYKIVKDASNNFMYSREEKGTDGYQSSKTAYVFKPTEQETVLYVKSFSSATKKTSIEAYTKYGKDGEFENALSKQEAFMSDLDSRFGDIEFYSSYFPGTNNCEKDHHYYSTGEGNLTAKLSFTFTEKQDVDSLKTIKRTYKYSNDLIVSFNATYMTFEGKKKTESASVSYNSVKVNIPSDWEEHVMTSVSI